MMNMIINQKDGHSKAVLLLLMTAVLWSTGGVLIKLVSWNPIAIAGMRSAIASAIILIYVRKPKFTWSIVQVGGAVAYSLTVILFVSATKLTTAANAILLQYTAPVYVALLGAWLLDEKVTRRDWITIFCVLGGMLLFFIEKFTPGKFWGNIAAILSGFAFAMVTVLMRKQKDGSPVETVLLGNILTSIIALPFMFGPGPGGKGWIGLVLLGVFQLGISYILYSKAIKYATALEAILVPVIEPLLNPVWVFLITGENPGPWAILGGLVVVTSVTLRCILPMWSTRHMQKEM